MKRLISIFIFCTLLVSGGMCQQTGPAGGVTVTPGNANITMRTNGTTVAISSSGGGGLIAAINQNAPQGGVLLSYGGTILTSSNIALSPLQFAYDAVHGYWTSLPTAQSDTRDVQVSDGKGVSITYNVPVVIMTNNGPCTIKSVRIGMGGFSSYYPEPIVEIDTDNRANIMQLSTLLANHGIPGHQFHGDMIDSSGSGFVNAGNRLFYQSGLYDGINCRTNARVVVTAKQPTGGPFTIYYDVTYKVGPPVVTNAWYFVEAQSAVNGGSVMSVGSLSDVVGQLISLDQFVCASNGNLSFLESRPTVYTDGQPAPSVIANGNEDFFGGTDYYNGLLDVYATPKWGVFGTPYMSDTFVYSNAVMAYRFFGEGVYFSNSMSVNYTNVYSPGSYISNLFGLEYVIFSPLP